MAVPLSDEASCYLVARIAHDLNIQDKFPEASSSVPGFFEQMPVSSLGIQGLDFSVLVERLFSTTSNADMYFSCLATLLKARLKFERILEKQPFPTMDQVGPRGLLQYGSLSPQALVALLFWRKWLYDTDNRAAQETGYLFEPILAAAIGGTPVGARRSPVKRASNKSKGRQVDCIKGKKAYEFKLRLTIASSGQGRWGEELQFPEDCVQSGFTPVFVVLDPTDNPKLSEITRVFEEAGGETYVGDDAWSMLEQEAGPVMWQFLERYVRAPLDSMIAQSPVTMPNLMLSHDGESITFTVGKESLTVERTVDETFEVSTDEIPEDVDEGMPGA